MEKPQISRAAVKFVQDGNTLGSTDICETITVFLEFQLPGEMPFFVLKTKGWSCELDEITELLNRVSKIAEEP